MTEEPDCVDREDERDQYGAKTNDDHDSPTEQAKVREGEMEESGEENAA